MQVPVASSVDALSPTAAATFSLLNKTKASEHGFVLCGSATVISCSLSVATIQRAVHRRCQIPWPASSWACPTRGRTGPCEKSPCSGFWLWLKTRGLATHSVRPLASRCLRGHRRDDWRSYLEGSVGNRGTRTRKQSGQWQLCRTTLCRLNNLSVHVRFAVSDFDEHRSELPLPHIPQYPVGGEEQLNLRRVLLTNNDFRKKWSFAHGEPGQQTPVASFEE